jgi:anti-anti-sigma regulatory factor
MMNAPLPEQHSLVMYQSSARQRSRTMTWMADALTRGDKVLYRAVDVAAPLDELGTAGEAARESGQLEILDARMCHEQTDGRHWALRELHEELLDQAHAEGYAGVLLTADEHALRVLAPEPAERLAFEHDLDRLTSRFGVRALCCYDLRVEQPDLLQAVAGVHFRGVDDVQWSARLSDGRLLVRGAIDADNAGRFGAALRVAATHDVRTVDLADVTVVSAAGVRAFDDAVDLLRRRARRLRLVNLSPAVNRALTLLRGADDDQVDLIPEHAEEPAGDTRLAAAAREFATLTGVLLAGPTVATVLDRITRAAVSLVPGADLASITLRGPDGAFHTPTTTEDEAIELDQLQYALDEGPCVDAARVAGHAVAVSEDLAVDTTWPRFGRAAAGHGVRSVLSTALQPDPWPRRTTGALNIYSRTVGAMTDADRDVALILAGHAWLALANTDPATAPAEATALPELENARLRDPVDGREMVGLVTGTLMHRRGISADEAFDLLHDLSQRLNARLAESRDQV